MDFESVPLVHAIFWLRSALFGSAPETSGRPRGLVAITRSLGWRPLAERPHRELVMGAVTQPWLADVIFRPLEPEQFKSFSEPGFVKIAWSLEATPLDAGPLDAVRTLFRTQTRALSTDAQARRKFRGYWRRVVIGVILIRKLMLRAVRREAERRYRELPPPR